MDSVDSLKLAQRLNAAAAEFNKALPILLEINVGGEEAKSGIALDCSAGRAIVVTEDPAQASASPSGSPLLEAHRWR